MKKTSYIISALLLTTLFSCSDSEVGPVNEGDRHFPLNNKYDRRVERGSVLQAGGFLFNNKEDEDKLGASMGAGGVNSYLWRATLDVVSFMPLQSADAVGGIIITDWYEDSASKGERIKANVLISSDELRADALKVKLFRQTLDGAGRWRDATANSELGRKLEDKILNRARELKIDGERI